MGAVMSGFSKVPSKITPMRFTGASSALADEERQTPPTKAITVAGR
jgi:hypothetical protein